VAQIAHFVDTRTPEAARRARKMTIVAQDPSITDANGRIVVAQVSVPVDLLEPGPRGQRFHVVDYDATQGVLLPAVDVRDPAADEWQRPWSYVDRFVGAEDAKLIGDPGFHAQNLYAIAVRTLAAFELALGRRLPWAFGGHQLYLVPHAFSEANAHYAGDDRGVFFGYLELGEETVYTCLSHDIVAHETTHAILDGLRPRFIEPGLPDQAAFHEAFADVVALLSVFSVGPLIETVLGRSDVRGRIPARRVERQELEKTALFTLAEQFGEATSGVRGSALRRSLELEANDKWRRDLAFEEPHRRGEVVVAAVMRALIRMWSNRLEALIYGGGLDRERAAEEGAKAATHLLQMAIRAIDYAPAVELEFEDFIDALLVSDQVVAPDDLHGYRDSIAQAFAAFGIVPPAASIVDLADQPLLYEGLNFVALRSDPDEVFRFIWQNASRLGIDRRYYLRVESVRPSLRIGPDGLIVHEVVADYVQTVNVTAAQAAPLGVAVPADLEPTTQIQLWGGGTLIFDQFGMAKFHQSKPLEDWERQSRRLEYLLRHGFFDTRGRLGFSFGTPLGMRFAEFHEPNTRAGEDW
jgi:hypothetical protein